jgi:hypothetical protein
MLSNGKPAVEIVEDIASKPGFIFWTETAPTSVAISKLNSVGWEQRSNKLRESMEIAERVYDLLGSLPDVLNVSQKETLRSSITIPWHDPNKSMVALVSRDSKTGLFYSHTHANFTWGDKPNGIAGYCAKYREYVLIPDLKKRPKRYRDYWVQSSTSVAGGIVALPLLNEFPDRKTGRPDCIAVLTVSSKKRRLINKNHLPYLEHVANEIKSILLQSTILPTPQEDAQELVDQLFPRSYHSDTMRERSTSNSESPADKILVDVITDLHAASRRGKKPMKAAQLLKRFKEAGDKGITMEELYPYFEDNPDKERSIVSFIGNLNTRYLSEQGLHIEGTIVYRVTKHTDKTRS